MKEQESGPGSPPEVCAGDPMAFGARYLPHYRTLAAPGFHRELCALWKREIMKKTVPAPETLEKMRSSPGHRLALAAPGATPNPRCSACRTSSTRCSMATSAMCS